ncbi:Secreted RxLR effector protein [Phytophthora ramorum]|uniref:Secreted RxLR effector protein n=1 Tax=Phytophthora ramorum TaxID=164328 RepID=UPI003095B4BF|nr:Secreted RxLR effector protein [Phytophthora ramorum]
MRLCNAFLASLLILLAITVAAEKSTRSSSIPDVGYNRGRLLRKTDTAKANAIDTEERGIWSSIKNWGKMDYWLTVGKSDDEVKKALKMDGLTGAALKPHPNYKQLEKFMYKREGQQMDNWLAEGMSTKDVWNDLGLAGMSKAQRKNSDELRAYVRYATKYDDECWNYKNTVLEPPIEYGGSPAEMKVKVQIWAKANREKWYVKEMLGLDGMSTVKREANPNNKYYLEFLDLTKRSER